MKSNYEIQINEIHEIPEGSDETERISYYVSIKEIYRLPDLPENAHFVRQIYLDSEKPSRRFDSYSDAEKAAREWVKERNIEDTYE